MIDPKKPYRKKMVLALAMLMLPGAFLAARNVTILVKDADLEMPLEGAVIRSWDGTDHVSDADGLAEISVPGDRQVSVQISYPGYAAGRLSIPTRGDSFSLGLRPGTALESRELVIEAARPGSSETKTGRSVAISGENLERSSQIGLIEDVMTSIKLLPGVGYTGMFNALPSIRGGDPGDLMAVLDGFYIENPYHWGGGFSIFDPHMTASAQLSHGIFSSRYGHTVSGLLEVSSKRAAADHAELELGISTSAVNLNAAMPLGAKGGLLLMGKVTYWDPFIWALKELSGVWDNESLDMINAVTTAPFIRSAAASFNYRFNSDLELTATAFVGTDGVGADYLNESQGEDDGSGLLVSYKSRAVFDWDNMQTFVISGLSFNPTPSTVLSARAGAGYEEALINGGVFYDYLRVSDAQSGSVRDDVPGTHLDTKISGKQSAANLQGRLDFDWSLGNGFLAAAGVEELFSRRVTEMEGRFFYERKISVPYPPLLGEGNPPYYLHYPVSGQLPETRNSRFNSSAYALAEYSSPGKRFGAELGLRLDHLYFKGSSFDLRTSPVLNPRLNLDFNLYRGSGIISSLDITGGTGLFSSVNDAISSINTDSGISNISLRPNRSWTSVFGLKTGFSGGWSFNIEGYYKYVYDRAYQYMILEPGKEISSAVMRFNGEGIVWGFDFMIQKFESRYWDGWLSYTFTRARYHEPESPARNFDGSASTEITDEGWYYPYFHRFHNLNLVLNFKPSKKINIYARLGLASGRPKPAAGEIKKYDVYVLNDNGVPVYEEDGITPRKITKYKRENEYSDNSRTTWSVPLDVKFSYMNFNPRNKVLTEMYIAAENLFSLFYTAQANSTFNQYTGQEDSSSDAASYEMPVPMLSVGIKWSY